MRPMHINRLQPMRPMHIIRLQPMRPMHIIRLQPMRPMHKNRLQYVDFHFACIDFIAIHSESVQIVTFCK